MKKQRFIGIAGGSCSGKTVLAMRLADGLGADETRVIGIDSYYIGLPGMPAGDLERYNFDDPSALDHRLLDSHLSALADGRSIDVPVYDFTTHTRTDRVTRVAPARFVIVEGLFSLYWEDVRAFFDTKIFIDVPHELCLARRIERDTRERGRPREEVIRRYETMARPMYDAYVLPSRSHADVVVDGTLSAEEIARMVIASVLSGRGKTGRDV